MPVDEQTQIIERLGSLERKIDHLCGLMDGASDPEKGMIVRLDRLEQKQIEADRQRVEMSSRIEGRRGLLWTAIIGMAVAVTGSFSMCCIGIWMHYK